MKEGITFFLQEDDAYRFRFQWMAKYIDPKNLWRRLYYFVSHKKYSFAKELEQVFNFIGNAEIVPDMKGRTILIRRILFFFLEDPHFSSLIKGIVDELDWKKLCLSKADAYYFRGKYFKVDFDKFDY